MISYVYNVVNLVRLVIIIAGKKDQPKLSYDVFNTSKLYQES